MDTKFNQLLLLLGKTVESEDASNYAQCVDFAFAWVDILGIDRAAIRHLYAFQVWTQPNDLTVQYFDVLPNTPNYVPKQGDLVIFNTGVGVAGHIAVATGKGDINSFTSLDQNWNGVKKVEEVTHNYSNFYGGLRPRMFEKVDQAAMDELRKERDRNWDLYQQEITKLTNLKNQIKQLVDAS